MIAVLQRVSHASVSVEGEVVGKCGKGLMILLGVSGEDTEKDADVLSAKISKLRVFNDENDKMNLSLLDIGGEVLVVSNFTLLANYKHGNRPDYLGAAAPAVAEALYEDFCRKLSVALGKDVETGRFGAEMKVDIAADGPITIVMDSKVLIKK